MHRITPGLFSSARDVAAFCQMLLNGGQYGEVWLIQDAAQAAILDAPLMGWRTQTSALTPR